MGKKMNNSLLAEVRTDFGLFLKLLCALLVVGSVLWIKSYGLSAEADNRRVEVTIFKNDYATMDFVEFTPEQETRMSLSEIAEDGSVSVFLNTYNTDDKPQVYLGSLEVALAEDEVHKGKGFLAFLTKRGYYAGYSFSLAAAELARFSELSVEIGGVLIRYPMAIVP